MNYVDYSEPSFAPQGWQCPICKRVYSPSTTMCFSCGNTEEMTTTTTTPYTENYLTTATMDKWKEIKATFCKSDSTEGGTASDEVGRV